MMDGYRNLPPKRILSVPCKEAAAERFMAVSDDRLNGRIFHNDGDGFDAAEISSLRGFKRSILVESSGARFCIFTRDRFNGTKRLTKGSETQRINFHNVILPGYMVDAEKMNINYRRNLKGRLQASSNASIFSISKNCKPRIYVAKSVNLAARDKGTFENHDASCIVCKHKEDHRAINHAQGEKSEKVVIASGINRSLAHYDCNKGELLAVPKRALSLSRLSNDNIRNRDTNAKNSAIDNNIGCGTIIPENYTFLRERKLPKLRWSQFNHLAHQVLHQTNS